MLRLTLVFLLLGCTGAQASPADDPCLPDTAPSKAPGYPLVRGEAGGKVYEFHVTIDGKAMDISSPKATGPAQPEALACTKTS